MNIFGNLKYIIRKYRAKQEKNFINSKWISTKSIKGHDCLFMENVRIDAIFKTEMLSKRNLKKQRKRYTKGCIENR